MELHLKIVGCLMIALAFVHIFFPRHFNWKQELKDLRLINRQMMWVHAFFIALVVLLMGLLCLTSSGELTGSLLGRKLALGLGLFWMIRLIVQFFGYLPENWKGRRLETGIHVFLSFLWAYFSIVFFMVYWMNK
jgi:hypothetical protein